MQQTEPHSANALTCSLHERLLGRQRARSFIADNLRCFIAGPFRRPPIALDMLHRTFLKHSKSARLWLHNHGARNQGLDHPRCRRWHSRSDGCCRRPSILLEAISKKDPRLLATSSHTSRRCRIRILETSQPIYSTTGKVRHPTSRLAGTCIAQSHYHVREGAQHIRIPSTNTVINRHGFTQVAHQLDTKARACTEEVQCCFFHC